MRREASGLAGLPGLGFDVSGNWASGSDLTNRFASFTDPASQRRGNYGFYLTGEQMVFREVGAVSGQGQSLDDATAAAHDPRGGSVRADCSLVADGYDTQTNGGGTR